MNDILDEGLTPSEPQYDNRIWLTIAGTAILALNYVLLVILAHWNLGLLVMIIALVVIPFAMQVGGRTRIAAAILAFLAAGGIFCLNFMAFFAVAAAAALASLQVLLCAALPAVAFVLTLLDAVRKRVRY